MPEVGEIWEDTFLVPVEWCEVLHVSKTHVLLQRRTGLSRYPLEEFTSSDPRFRFITVED